MLTYTGGSKVHRLFKSVYQNRSLIDSINVSIITILGIGFYQEERIECMQEIVTLLTNISSVLWQIPKNKKLFIIIKET